jgi:hypothetical protein
LQAAAALGGGRAGGALLGGGGPAGQALAAMTELGGRGEVEVEQYQTSVELT